MLNPFRSKKNDPVPSKEMNEGSTSSNEEQITETPIGETTSPLKEKSSDLSVEKPADQKTSLETKNEEENEKQEKANEKKKKKKRQEKNKESQDPTKPPKPDFSKKMSSWSKEAKDTFDTLKEDSAPQPDAYSFEAALQNHKPSLPNQEKRNQEPKPLSPQAFMLKYPGKPLGLSQVLQVCMSSVWIYLALSFVLGLLLGMPLGMADSWEVYLTGYSLIFWLTTISTSTMAIGYGSFILKANPFKAFQNKHFDRHWIWKGFGMMVAANLILSLITTLFMELFSTFLFPLAPSPDFDVTGMPLFAGALEFMVVCLVGPILEELLYRGLIYRQLSRFNQGFAIVFSALLFGLAHGNLGQAVPTFGVGLVLAYTYAKSDSIWVPIILHVLNNTCLMIITTFPVLDVVMSILLWVIAIVGVWVFFQERKEWKALFYQANQDGQTWSLVSRMPSFWLYVVAFLILSVV